MKHQELITLLNSNAYDRIRKKLKRMAVTDRMKSLQICVPYVKSNPSNLKFFKENFSAELGAIIISKGDLAKASDLYKTSNK